MDLLEEFEGKNSACKPIKGIYIFMHIHTYIDTLFFVCFVFRNQNCAPWKPINTYTYCEIHMYIHTHLIYKFTTSVRACVRRQFCILIHGQNRGPAFSMAEPVALLKLPGGDDEAG
jgi:hypothetical protein